MFSIVNGNGARSEYVPGALRSRRVQPILPVGAVREPEVGHGAEEEGEGKAGQPILRGRSRDYLQSSAPRAPEAALLARQIMSRPLISLEESALFGTAWDLILERRFRHLPIRTEAGRITGILSDRDMLRWSAGSNDPAIPVREIMATPVLIAHPDTEIRDVARVLFEEHIGAIPIVDSESKPVGILTRSDILRAVIQRAPLHLWI